MGPAELNEGANSREFNQFFEFDASADLTASENTDDVNIEQWSQEFRLISTDDSPFTWLVGAMFAKDTNTTETLTDLEDFADPPFVPFSTLASYEQETETWALYGQAGYDILENVNINASLRYTVEDKDFFYRVDADFDFDDVLETPFIDGVNSETSLGAKWSGHLGIDWKVREDTLLYAKYSRGFKSGGFYAGLTGDPASVAPYAEETNDALEIGLKSNPIEDLQINAAVFYYFYQDTQGEITIPSAIAPSGSVITIGTLGDAEHFGIELDTLWTPSQLPGFSLQVSGAYLDAEIVNSNEVGIGQDLSVFSLEGLDRRFSPEFSFAINARQEKYLTSTLLGSFSENYSWRDDLVTEDTEPNDLEYGIFQLDSYGLLNLRAAIKDIDKGWEISLSGENVTGEEYFTRTTIDGVFGFLELPGRPASWKVEAKIDF